jgi:transcriptional regulator with XRE-family HTH domain
VVAPTQRARAALTEALRTARRSGGLTGSTLAERLGPGWAQPKISKIESGRQFPTEEETVAWAKATGADPNVLLALHARAGHEYAVFRDAFRTEGGPDRHQEAYAAAEQAASLVFGFQPNIVHGLLQTPEYARHLLSLPGGPADHGATQDEIDRMVAARMRRTAVLYEPGRTVTVLIGEAALHNVVGSPAVMRDQLAHITRLATTLTHATIGIVPFERFPVLVQHGWDQRDQIISLETTAGDLEIADPTEVAQYARWADVLRSAAIVRDDAADLCRQLTGSQSYSSGSRSWAADPGKSW